MYQRTPPRTIHILAFDDNDELDVIGPYEILQTIGKVQQCDVPQVSIVSVPGTTKDRNVVHGIHGLTFGTRPLESGEKPDLLIVAGGGFGTTNPPRGIMVQMCNEAFTSVIASQLDEGRQLVSVCTGAMGLVGAGVVNGRTMTTHPVAVSALRDAGANVLDPDTQARVVDDGSIVSCGGVTSGTDETLYLASAFWSNGSALETNLRAYIDYNFRAQIVKA
jgi:transcriptional regulator GlxA family with amidase domain